MVSQGDDQQLNRAFSQHFYEQSESRLTSKDIIKKIESLDEAYREPFIKYYVGYKYEDIAQQMNLPLGTIKSRIFIARKKNLLLGLTRKKSYVLSFSTA